MEKNDLDKVYYAPNPVVKRTNVNRKPLFYGLILGIILFAAIYIGLYYSGNIASPKNLIKNNKPVTVNNISPILQEKARKAGYEIIWQGDPNDTTGRTIMASEKRIGKDGFKDKFGWQEFEVGKNRDIKINLRGQGVFKKWEKIQDSKDLYAIYYTPEDLNKEEKIRVALAGVSLTSFFQDNLNYGSKNNKIEQYKKLAKVTEDNKLIKAGDIIVFFALPKFENKIITGVNFDKSGVQVIEKLIIRKFEK